MNAADEQDLRDRLHRAMSACDQTEAETVMAQMVVRGLENVDVIACNAFLDLDERARNWWMGTQPGPGGYGFVSYTKVYARINEAARREYT